MPDKAPYKVYFPYFPTDELSSVSNDCAATILRFKTKTIRKHLKQEERYYLTFSSGAMSDVLLSVATGLNSSKMADA